MEQETAPHRLVGLLASYGGSKKAYYLMNENAFRLLTASVDMILRIVGLYVHVL